LAIRVSLDQTKHRTNIIQLQPAFRNMRVFAFTPYKICYIFNLHILICLGANRVRDRQRQRRKPI
jgi:hypothetical protein